MIIIDQCPSFEIIVWKGNGFKTNTDAHIEVKKKISCRGMQEYVQYTTNFANSILSLKDSKG